MTAQRRPALDTAAALPPEEYTLLYGALLDRAVRQPESEAMASVLELTAKVPGSWPTLTVALGNLPPGNIGIASLDAYVFFTSAGAVSLMLAYLMTEVAAIVCTVAGRFRQTRAGDGGRVLGVGLPFIGVVVLATVLWYNVKGPQVLWTSPACAGLAWSAIGLLAALLARRACCGCAPRWPWSWGSL